MELREQLSVARVLPVLTAQDVDSTLLLVDALVAGGMSAVEITLRTDAALDSLRAVKTAHPDLAVAAGTVTCADDMRRALEAGADFCVSPGISTELLETAAETPAAFLPGVASASEIMLGLAHGLDTFKLFPAVPVGGIALLQSFAGPFPTVQFCPTGGLSPQNYRDFLALPNVICCGGSWMVAAELVRGCRWSEIETLAREAVTGAAN